jgi:hypothetical protein
MLKLNIGKRMIALASVLAVSLVGFSAQAQDSVDPAVLATITAAFEQTRAVEAVRVESQTNTELALGQGMSFSQQGTSGFDLVRAGEVWNAQGSQTSTLGLPTGEVEIITETVILDGVTYLRIDGEMPQGFGGGDAGGQAMPEGWFDAAQLAEGQDDAGQEMMAAGGGDMLLGALGLPITAESVTAVTELEPDEIDGQAVRVYQLTLDAAAVIDSDAAGLLTANIGGGFGGGFPGGGPGGFPGGDAPAPQITPPADMPEGTPAPINPEDVQITFAVYIGQDDGYVHRIYSVIALAPSAESQFAITLTSITNFLAFNEPAAITAPELGS